MATYSSILAWRIPWTEEPGRLQSMGSQRDQTRLKRRSMYATNKMIPYMVSAVKRILHRRLN